MTEPLHAAPEQSTSRGSIASEVLAVLAVFVPVGGMAISLALLIFSGPLVSEFPRALGSFLIGAAILAGALAWRGRFVPSVGVLQDGPAIVMVPVAVSIATDDGLGPEAVIVALGIVGMLTALVMLWLSCISIEGIVRYLPTSIVVAFIAGTGWYLAKGGFEVIAAKSIGWRDLGALLSADQAPRWLLGVLLGVSIVLLGRSKRTPPAAASAAILVSIGLFYSVAVVVSSVDTVEAEGWLIGPFPAGASVSPISPDEVSGIDWAALAAHTPGLLAVVAVGVLAMLLNYSGLEVITGERPDYSNELRVTGLAALITVPFGSIVGYLGLGDTVLAGKMGVRRRATVAAVAALVAAMAIFGADAVAMTPRFVAGGLLFAIGLELLLNWIAEIRSTTDRIDRVASFVVVAAMAVIGILEGLAIGLVLTCALFIVRYSKIDHVRRVSSGLHRSRVERSPEDAEFVAAAGGRIEVFELEGYLFFGSVVSVAEQVRARCASTRDLDAVILDFRHVSGIDTNGAVALERVRSAVTDRGAVLVFSGLDAAGGAVIGHAVSVEILPTLDMALEAIEDRQLSERRRNGARPSGSTLLGEDVLAWFTTEHVLAGGCVVEDGAPSNDMYVVAEGTLDAVVTDDDGNQRRLRRFGHDTFLGEIGFFQSSSRTAAVVAATDSTLYRLERSRYEQMRRDAPELAFELHDKVLTGQASRVRTLSDELRRALGS